MVSFLTACVVAGTPLLFAIIGESITEKSGSLNLGVEGQMLIGSVAGFMVGLNTGSAILAVLAAALFGGLMGLIFAVLTVTLRANQTVTGLTLTIFGTGVTLFVGRPVVGVLLPSTVTTALGKIAIPGLSDIPAVGHIFFRQDPLVYFSYLVVIVSAIYMYKTRTGMNMRAVGESNAAADASGINVVFVKYAHIIIGSMLCGIGGAYLSLVRVPIWQENVVNGRGWIAVALVIFASWNPVKAFFCAILFGGLSIVGLRLQTMGINVSQYLVDMIPYIATVIIVIISTAKKKRENQPPVDLGSNYFREER